MTEISDKIYKELDAELTSLMKGIILEKNKIPVENPITYFDACMVALSKVNNMFKKYEPEQVIEAIDKYVENKNSQYI